MPKHKNINVEKYLKIKRDEAKKRIEEAKKSGPQPPDKVKTKVRRARLA